MQRVRTLPNLQVFAPAEAAVDRSEDAALVHIAGGPSVACQLVVAAEGRNSPLRAAAGIPVTRFDYPQTGIVCAIKPRTATPGRCAGAFPAIRSICRAADGAKRRCRGGGAPNVSAIVWTERARIAATVLGLDDARFAREIRRRLGDHLGQVRTVGRRWTYPLSAMLAHRYVDSRLALAGDAAHGIHRLAGQG